MFGKIREHNDMDTLHDVDPDEFFGDEEAAAEAANVEQLRDRVESVEAQINSQFTSLATYAQIAQEQVELARAEARSHTERAEQRVTSLIERERADRIQSITGEAPAGSAPDVAARLDALEHSVAQIRSGLADCLERQKQLADAITALFDRGDVPVEPADADEAVETVETDAAFESDVVDETGTVDELDDAADPEPSGALTFSIPPLPAPDAALAPPSTPMTGPIADLSLDR